MTNTSKSMLNRHAVQKGEAVTNTPMTSREAFEKWADGLVCFDLENEEYINPNTHLLWCLFKEKTQTIAELVEALELTSAICAGETLSKSTLIKALEKTQAILAKVKGTTS